MPQQWKFYFLLFVALTVVGNCQEEEEAEASEESEPGGNNPYDMPADVLAEIHLKMDADKDGNVSWPEMKAFGRTMRILNANKNNISSLVEGTDANKDGKLQLEEILKEIDLPLPPDASPDDKAMEEKYKQSYVSKFKAADRNADGVLEADEVRFFFYPELNDGVVAMLATATMKQKDKDGDGKLTHTEFLELEGASNETLDASGHMEAEEFSHVDADEDGLINEEELKAYEAGTNDQDHFMKLFFHTADTDGDSVLTLAELQQEYETDMHYEAKQHFDAWRQEL